MQVGDFAGALALADTILARTPGHLFGYIVRGTAAGFQGDSAAARRAARDFLSHYAAEIEAGRLEYREHEPALEEFKQQAKGRRDGEDGEDGEVEGWVSPFRLLRPLRLSVLKPMPRTIHVAHSPDSDDAFMFYALAEGKIDTGDLRYVHELADIESLNQRARRAELEVTAVSIHAYAYLWRDYALLGSGSSMGDGYGPRLVATRPRPGGSPRRAPGAPGRRARAAHHRLPGAQALPARRRSRW